MARYRSVWLPAITTLKSRGLVEQLGQKRAPCAGPGGELKQWDPSARGPHRTRRVEAGLSSSTATEPCSWLTF